MRTHPPVANNAVGSHPRGMPCSARNSAASDHAYVIIPTTSPKRADLLRDGRYALQAFPPVPNDEGEEFYISGVANRIQDPEIRQALINDTKLTVEENEVLFELLLERVMYTKLVERGTPGERPVHRKWRA